MKILQHNALEPLRPNTVSLLKRMLHPFCGLNREIGLISRSSQDPHIITMGANLTGVHHLLNRPDPGPGAYHTGGCGIFFEEATIRSLGESVERYAQLLAAITNRYPTRFCSYEDILSKGERCVDKKLLDFFTEYQLQRPDFPFHSFDPRSPFMWVQLPSLTQALPCWAPMQSLFVGYNIDQANNELRINSAVTTGTAAHTDPHKALLNALLEHIQIDSAMGHWYSAHDASEVVFDKRTRPLERILDKYHRRSPMETRFYWLKNPDLPGFSIACVAEQPEDSIPRFAVGLGSDMGLVNAMYKAYLEANGVTGLARLLVVQAAQGDVITPHLFYDLDTNVLFYAQGHGKETIQKKFNAKKRVKACELPQDNTGEVLTHIKQILQSCKASDIEFLFANIDCEEGTTLGFHCSRVWSPQLLSLSLPSAAWAKHPRFQDYGGFQHDAPHPYP